MFSNEYNLCNLPFKISFYVNKNIKEINMDNQ